MLEILPENPCLSDNSRAKASARDNCPDKTRAKFPVFTQMIRKLFYPPAAMKALDNAAAAAAAALYHIHTVKDRLKQECDAGFL